jgi:hypothetical protein
MQNRRKFFLVLTTSFVAFGLIAGSAVADELLGVLTKVDAEAKKVTVIEKGTDKEIVVTVNDETEWVTKKGTAKFDFAKVTKQVEKSQGKGNKGINVKVDHEKGVASKIAPVYAAKKKDAAN